MSAAEASVADKIAENWNGDGEVVDATESADPANQEDSLADRLKDADPHEIEKAILKIESDLCDIEERRSSASADITATIAEGEVLGLNKEAIKVGHKYVNWDNKKRDSFLNTLVSYLRAHGHHMQKDLFD